MWYDGHSLADTIFTCVYLHRVDAIADPVIAAYARSFLRVCEMVRDSAIQADVYHVRPSAVLFSLLNVLTD